MAKDDSVAKSGNQQLPVENKVESLIRVIRGQQVMLDRDLAELYGVETRRLNEQVKRNIERFPEDFMFQLPPNEFDNLKSQFATSSFKLTICDLENQILFFISNFHSFIFIFFLFSQFI